MTHIVDDNVQWGGACHKRFPNRKWSFLKRTLLLITNSVFEGSTSSIYRKSYPFHSNDQKASLGIITKAFCSSASVAIWWAFFISKWFVNLLLFIVCWDDDNSEDVSKMKPFCKWATERCTSSLPRCVATLKPWERVKAHSFIPSWQKTMTWCKINQKITHEMKRQRRNKESKGKPKCIIWRNQ